MLAMILIMLTLGTVMVGSIVALFEIVAALERHRLKR